MHKKNYQKAGTQIEASCSISHKYSEGSCFTIEELKSIAEAYNKAHSDKIEISDKKETMISKLQEKLKEKCKDQTCWATLQFLNNNEELNLAFKTKGPAGQYDWLSTTEINGCMETYMQKHKDFIFIGAVPIDIEDLDQFGVNKLNYNKVINSGKTKIGIVFNLDKHDQAGSHWVAFFVNFDKNQIYYSDSASNPPDLRVKKLVKKIAEVMYKRKYSNQDEKLLKLNANTYMNDSGPNAMEQLFDIRYNKTKHQYGGSECGVYSMNFIIRLLNGDTFDEIHKQRITDKDIHVCRREYFIGETNRIEGDSKYDTFC